MKPITKKLNKIVLLSILLGCSTYAAACTGTQCIIFATQDPHNGNFGGYAGADNFCNDEAKNSADSNISKLYTDGIKFKALLGGHNAAVSGKTYYQSNQQTIIAVADSGNLNANLQNPISDHDTIIHRQSTFFWSGIDTNGASTDGGKSTRDGNCLGYTHSDDSNEGNDRHSTVGAIGTAPQWTNLTGRYVCNNSNVGLACVAQ